MPSITAFAVSRTSRLGFPSPLSRVLLNLTTNALKFTDEGLIEITVQELADQHIEFSVRDTGRGLDPDALNTLFRPFRRTRGRKGHSFSGSGLGLMISRRLVEAMSSELRLETRTGWGTRFFFQLQLPQA
jgi:two-component system, sensor histidine kinase and response regulator